MVHAPSSVPHPHEQFCITSDNQLKADLNSELREVDRESDCTKLFTAVAPETETWKRPRWAYVTIRFFTFFAQKCRFSGDQTLPMLESGKRATPRDIFREFEDVKGAVRLAQITINSIDGDKLMATNKQFRHTKSESG